MMNFIYYYMFLIVGLVPEVFGVRVTLESGRTGEIPVEVTQGEPKTLQCNYQATSGNGETQINWLYDHDSSTTSQQHIVFNAKVVEGKQDQYSFVNPASLQIKSATKDLAGFYSCAVTIVNDVPSLDSGTYNLTVNVPPSKPSCQFTSDYALTIGFNAEFRCYSSEGIPSPQYTWVKDGRDLPVNGQNVEIYKNTSYSYNKDTGTMMFSKVVPGDAGVYFCKSTNKVGEEMCTAVTITTKDQDVGMIVGIVFGVIFGLLLIGVLVWWTWRKGYCDGITNKDEMDDIEDDGSNDIMLDGNGPAVHKPPSEYNGSTGKQEASMMI
ncbi:junctional adhesion molecule A-like isoform X2 [Clavelina lepadiformis]|uniref:junctional adhesion molecule A-like isoform X2 n=1 Tax=Clavelina lepadiformis TaxID=159417 RepID=UPI0040437563